MKFIINDIEYIARDLNDLSLGEYNELFNFINTEKNPRKLNIGLLSLFTDIPIELIEQLDTSIYQINWKLKLQEELRGKQIQKNYLNNDLIDLKKITLGRFIDLDYFLTQAADNRIQTVVALMIAPSDYDIESINDLSIKIEKKLSIGDCLVIFNHFSNWRTDLLKKYDGLFLAQENEDDEEDIEVPDGENPPKFDEEDDEDNEVQEDKWGWMGTVYAIAGHYLKVDEVLQKPFIEFLNYLAWNKETIDKQNELEKRRNNSLH